jgi:hypothetical protein
LAEAERSSALSRVVPDDLQSEGHLRQTVVLLSIRTEKIVCSRNYLWIVLGFWLEVAQPDTSLRAKEAAEK